MEEFIRLHSIEFSALWHVLLSMFFGALIGIEREIANRPAGLKTHALVAGAAALIVSLGDIMITRFVNESGSQIVNTDPIRLVEAIITGISFLGAGTIFKAKDGENIEGLTTAASVLLTAAVGICTALGQIILSAGTVLLTLLALKLLAKFERKIP